MKKSIKMLAIMLSVLMIVSLMPATSFASGTVSTFVDTIDFEDLEVKEYTASSSDNVYIYEAGNVPPHSTAAFYLNKYTKTKTVPKAYIVAGRNGKASNDEYLYLDGTTDAGEVWLNATPKTFNKGDQYRFSLDYLPSASAITSNFRPEVKNSLETVFYFQQTAIKVAGTEYKIPNELRSKWVHIDIILTVGDGATGKVKDTFTTYLNGEKIIDAVEWNNYCQNGFSLGRWDFVGKAQAIDNISITRYTGGAVFSPAIPALISGGNSAATGYCNGTLYVADKTVSQVKTSLGTDANVKSYTAIDASGNVVADSAAAAGNTLLVKNINDMTYSVPMVGSTHRTSQVFNTSENQYTITPTSDFYGAGTAYKFEENVSSSVASATLHLSDNKNVPMYIRVPVLMESSKTNELFYITGKPYYNGEASPSSGHRLVKLQQGKIYIDDGTDSPLSVSKQVATYEKDKWFVVEVALFPGESSYTVRIDDGEIYTGTLGDTGKIFSGFSKNDYFQLVIPNNNDSCYIGAMDLYTGVPTDVTAPSLTAVPAGTTLVGNAITVPYGKDASAYITGSSITASNAPTVKFIGTDGKSITSNYNGGKMVLISNDGIYKYYTLNARQNACTLISTDEAGNRKYWVDLTTNDGSITPVIYSALFNGSLLSSVSPISIDDWELANTTFKFTVAPHTGSTTRKIMIWDKNTLVPLAGNLD